jgi:hypothetical protein
MNGQLNGLDRIEPVDPRPVALVEGTDLIAEAAEACPAVAGLHGGQFGWTATSAWATGARGDGPGRGRSPARGTAVRRRRHPGRGRGAPLSSVQHPLATPPASPEKKRSS